MDIKEIEHLAELSKLEFSQEELQSFSKEFEQLVEFADVVKNSSETGDINYTTVDMNDLREDIPKQSMDVEKLLQNTPKVSNQSIVVPRIVEWEIMEIVSLSAVELREKILKKEFVKRKNLILNVKKKML